MNYSEEEIKLILNTDKLTSDQKVNIIKEMIRAGYTSWPVLPWYPQEFGCPTPLAPFYYTTHDTGI